MGTATSVLVCDNRYPWLGGVNCTTDSVPFGQFGSNASITGIGTDISFVITGGFSLLTCFLVQVWCDRLRHHSYRKLLEPLVISFGDQQILRGLSLSIATLFFSSACTIDAYRYNVLAYLLMMAIVSHMSSVLVLRSYVQGQVVLSCVRFFLVLAQMIFAGYIFSSRVSDTFPTAVPSEGHNTTMVLPAVCFEHPGSEPYSALEDIPKSHTKDSAALTMYIMLFVFYGINLIITSAHVITYLRFPEYTWQKLHKKEEKAKVGSWFWWMGTFRGLVLLAATVIYIWAVIKMYELKHWMTNSGWMVGINLQNDNQWTFAQLLSALLLAAAPMAVLGAWSDFKLERKNIAEERAERLGIGPRPEPDPSGGDDRETFSASTPNPSYGSQTGLLGSRPGGNYSQPEFNTRRMSGYSGYSGNSMYRTGPPSYTDDIEMEQPFIPTRPALASVPSYRGD